MSVTIKIKENVEKNTKYNEVTIEGASDQFVYAMITENTGMKFELPQRDNTENISYIVWKDNNMLEQGNITNDITAVVDKANEIYNQYF